MRQSIDRPQNATSLDLYNTTCVIQRLHFDVLAFVVVSYTAWALPNSLSGALIHRGAVAARHRTHPGWGAHLLRLPLADL